MKTIINHLSQTIEKYYPLLKELTEDDFSLKPNREKWSKKEELGHLIDSAQNNIQRFIRVQYEENVYVMYDPENWVDFNDYQNIDSKNLIELWYLLNLQILTILHKMPVNKYESLMRFGEDKTIQNTTLFIAEDYVKHLTHHLESITKI